MRRFLLLITVFLISSSVAKVTESFYRTDKTPDFFVPAGALKKQPAPEKLPDVKQMQYQGQQAPIIVEMEQERIAQIEAAKQKQLEEQQRQERLQKYEKLKAQKEAETLARLNKNKEKVKTTANVGENIAKSSVAETKNKAEDKMPIPQIDENTDIHTRIIQEYVIDLEHISRGETVNNQRLDEMLSDWTDEIHTVK